MLGAGASSITCTCNSKNLKYHVDDSDDNNVIDGSRRLLNNLYIMGMTYDKINRHSRDQIMDSSDDGNQWKEAPFQSPVRQQGPNMISSSNGISDNDSDA